MQLWEHAENLRRGAKTRADHIQWMLENLPGGADMRTVSVLADVDNVLEAVQGSLMAQLKLHGLPMHPDKAP